MIAGFASVAWLTASVATPIMTAAFIAAILGVAVLMFNLSRVGSNLERRPEQDCRTHLKAQIRHQHEALRSVSKWYLAPLVPGLALIHIARAYEASMRIGWVEAVIDVTPSAVFAAGVLLAVRWLNLRAADKLEAEIRELDQLA